jgi:hypothetical protein
MYQHQYVQFMALRNNFGFLAAAALTCICFVILQWKNERLSSFSLFSSEWRNRSSHSIRYGDRSKPNQSRVEVIYLLIDQGVYDTSSFENEAGVIPPFWDKNSTSPCKPDETTTPELGPCFGSHQAIDWQLQANQKDPIPRYSPLMSGAPETMKTKNDWAGSCRPGFLIIGAGKCGTSVCHARTVLLTFILHAYSLFHIFMYIYIHGSVAVSLLDRTSTRHPSGRETDSLLVCEM